MVLRHVPLEFLRRFEDPERFREIRWNFLLPATEYFRLCDLLPTDNNLQTGIVWMNRTHNVWMRETDGLESMAIWYGTDKLARLMGHIRVICTGWELPPLPFEAALNAEYKLYDLWRFFLIAEVHANAVAVLRLLEESNENDPIGPRCVKDSSVSHSVVLLQFIETWDHYVLGWSTGLLGPDDKGKDHMDMHESEKASLLTAFQAMSSCAGFVQSELDIIRCSEMMSKRVKGEHVQEMAGTVNPYGPQVKVMSKIAFAYNGLSGIHEKKTRQYARCIPTKASLFKYDHVSTFWQYMSEPSHSLDDDVGSEISFLSQWELLKSKVHERVIERPVPTEALRQADLNTYIDRQWDVMHHALSQPVVARDFAWYLCQVQGGIGKHGQSVHAQIRNPNFKNFRMTLEQIKQMWAGHMPGESVVTELSQQELKEKFPDLGDFDTEEFQ